jgi:two-component system phosphate regulon sensor histidine kinase PhoR
VKISIGTVVSDPMTGTVTRRRSEFVIGMSHDLRTRIASMRILADSLSVGRVEDPEKQQHFLRTISFECERLGDMIERVLSFFRQEHRAITYTMTPVDIGEVVACSDNAFRERQHGRVSVGWIQVTLWRRLSAIPAKEHSRIFDRFYRRDTGLHKHVGGIGLGLSLCSDIMSAHRGRIVVDSRVGDGATFSVWLRSKVES